MCGIVPTLTPSARTAGAEPGGNNVLAAVGHCVGCANMRYADRAGIRAIILDSTFLSYSSIANQMIPGSGYLLDDRYSADRNIASVSPIPVLILHGTADHVIPGRTVRNCMPSPGSPNKNLHS